MDEDLCACGHPLSEHVQGLCSRGPCVGKGLCGGCPLCGSTTYLLDAQGPFHDVTCGGCGVLLERRREVVTRP